MVPGRRVIPDQPDDVAPARTFGEADARAGAAAGTALPGERGSKHRTRHEPHHDVWTIDAAVMTPPMTV
jgi:hypothetical protein